MISNKFKPGQKIYYMSYDKEKRKGVVVSRDFAQALEGNFPSDRPDEMKVWAKWWDGDFSWMPEDRVQSDEPSRPARNLPDWF